MGLFEASIYLYLFLFITNKRYLIKDNKYINILFLISHTLFSTWATLSFPPGYHTMLILSYVILSFTLITNTRVSSSVVVTTFIFACAMISELVLLPIFSIIASTNLEALQKDPQIKLYFGIFVRSVQIPLLFIISKIKSPKIKAFSKNFNNSVIMYSVLGVFLMSSLIMSIQFMIYQPDKIFLYEVLITLIFIIYTIIGYLDYKYKVNLINIQKQYELQDSYIKNLESLINIIRREKHDFSNHISTIYALCAINKPNTVERINDYLKNITNELNSLYDTFNTGNDYIDGLLVVKSNYAYENNILFDVNFESMLTNIKVDNVDLISIISNVLDNAFEAITLSEKSIQRPIVSLWSYVENTKYIISISNNGPQIKNENLEKIFKDGFSTKRKNSNDHGFGLYIVNKMVEKNEGEITAYSNEEETEFQIIFNLAGEENELYSKSI